MRRQRRVIEAAAVAPGRFRVSPGGDDPVPRDSADAACVPAALERCRRNRPAASSPAPVATPPGGGHAARGRRDAGSDAMRWMAGALVVLVAAAGPVACGRPVGKRIERRSSTRAAFEVIDSHVHITPTRTALSLALGVFARVGVTRFVVKSAGSVGSARYAATAAMQEEVGDRMRAFANLDWRGIDDPEFAERQVGLLERMKRDGIVGIKIFKSLGLGVRTADGALLEVDDPRLDPIFDACGRLGLIVAWHVADPVAFFLPPTPDNERYDELRIAAEWSFHGGDYPSHDDLIAARDRVLERHPRTTFLLIHLANYPENLDYVDRLLDTHPNVYVDTSARVPEFGRHPADAVRAFFLEHQDRILFGSDLIVEGDGAMQLGSAWPDPNTVPGIDDAVEFYARHWRYFETNERQIDHPTPIQGRWKVDAVGLPDDVLRKLYAGNADRLIFRDHPLPTGATPAGAIGDPGTFADAEASPGAVDAAADRPEECAGR